jgi:hypothetical protein
MKARVRNTAGPINLGTNCREKEIQVKPIQMLGLAVLGVLMAMALAGVSSARAESTALCTLDPGSGSHETCPAGYLFTHVHEASPLVNWATLLSNGLRFDCELLLLGDVTSGENLGAPLKMLVNFEYTNCTSGCEVEEASKSSTISILREGFEKAEVTGEGEVKVHCGTFIDCTYNGAGLKGTAKGPLEASRGTGEIVIQEQALTGSGTNCRKGVKLDLLITPSSSIYLTSGTGMAKSTSLCELYPGKGENEVCPKGHLVTHVHGTALAAKSATLLSSVLNVECSVLFLGDVISKNGLGSPLEILGNFTYTGCANGCIVTETSENSTISVLKEGHETAKVTDEGEVKVKCGFFISCMYDGEGLVGTAKGSLLSIDTYGEISIQEQELHKVGGLFCPSTGKLDIVITNLTSTYITE